MYVSKKKKYAAGGVIGGAGLGFLGARTKRGRRFGAATARKYRGAKMYGRIAKTGFKRAVKMHGFRKGAWKFLRG